MVTLQVKSQGWLRSSTWPRHSHVVCTRGCERTTYLAFHSVGTLVSVRGKSKLRITETHSIVTKAPRKNIIYFPNTTNRPNRVHPKQCVHSTFVDIRAPLSSGTSNAAKFGTEKDFFDKSSSDALLLLSSNCLL